MIEFLKLPYRMTKTWFRLLKILYWALLNILFRLKILTVKKIPIIINNFNRLSFPSQLISFLEKNGYKNIIILDNQSHYPPLLEYYKSVGHKVIHLQKNYGYLALWKSGLYDKYKWNYFVYTDSDVLPVEECPGDFLLHFKKHLDKRSSLDKIGFGIKIDDLPEHFSFRDKVIGHEKKFWQTEVEPGIYKAQIDTTFALYKPFTDLKFDEVSTLEAYRFGPPYVIRHLPWYTDTMNPNAEEKYYLDTANSSSGISRQLKSGDVYL